MIFFQAQSRLQGVTEDELTEFTSSGGKAEPMQVVFVDFVANQVPQQDDLSSTDSVPTEDFDVRADRISTILSTLNQQFADRNVVFVSERPELRAYSTITVGHLDASVVLENVRSTPITLESNHQVDSGNASGFERSDELLVAAIAGEADQLLDTDNEAETELGETPNSAGFEQTTTDVIFLSP